MTSIRTHPMIEANPRNIRLLREMINHRNWHTTEYTLVGFMSQSGRQFVK